MYIFGPKNEMVGMTRGYGSKLPMRANGLLLAAAPTLLDACEELLAYLEGLCVCGNNGGGDCDHCKAGANARLAIKAAKGGS